MLLGQHKKMQKLVASNTILPGIFSEEYGVIVYTPISKQQYDDMIKSGNIEKLAYNTFSMGRGIYTVGESGEIINYKGVDSRLDDSKNIAVGKVNAQVYDISALLGREPHPYGITVMLAPGQAPEIRVRGASQLQNLINEKQKLDETQKKDKEGIIKFPRITEIKALSTEFCERAGLPRAEGIEEAFIEQLRQSDEIAREETGGMLGNYAYICLEYMRNIGMPIKVKNQTWQEYFSGLPAEDKDKIKHIFELQGAIENQDKEYELGAIFGQTTRILGNPFRIMDLAYFVDNGMKDSVQAILDYTSEPYNEDYLDVYAKTMGKNSAGFMNLGLVYNNWAHRQDFSLSAEMCDDAYDDVSESIREAKSISEKEEHYKHIMKQMSMYYNQIYLFASNMKVIEDAYRMIGREIPESYQDGFIEAFIENLQNKEEILRAMMDESSSDFGEVLRRNGKMSAVRNFEGYEEYVRQFKEKFCEKLLEYLPKRCISVQEVEQGVGSQLDGNPEDLIETEKALMEYMNRKERSGNEIGEQNGE